jgi:hypothetical protein
MLAGLAIISSSARPQRFDFRFSQGAFRDDEIFDSALSVPGRYLLEVGRRILKAVPNADWLVIGNPLLPLRAEQLAGWLDGNVTGPMVATDRAKFPIFYVFPRCLFDQRERFLLLLSTLDAAIDAHLLSLLLQEEVNCRPLALETIGEPPALGPNGWLNGDQRLNVAKLQCTDAIALIESRSDWPTLPFVSFYPMHAGDVLFMSVASRMASNSLFSKQVVCSSYVDIPTACGSKLESMRLRLPWISRDGSVSELTYFVHALERLGDEARHSNFFVFSRILRLYFHTPFHLVDHARFALGDSLDAFEQTVHARPTADEARCQNPASPLRVLFHLNGGWKLKTYPAEYMRVIIGTLRGMGIDVTVIDRPDLQAAGAQSVTSEDSATLRRLVESHHIFVGVDSFPHHFSRLVLGWPTIGLFGNTKPCNSDARYVEGYRSSDQSLSCNRCGAYDACPVLNRHDCINYAPPARVVSDILNLARECYGYSA